MPRPGSPRVALLAAGASVLQVAESLVPHPLPGVRLGLANVLTLVVLAELGPAAAMQLALMRTVASSMVLGTFLSPAFLLSFSGAVVSTLVMIGGWWLAEHRVLVRPSLLGISVAGAAAHVLTQLLFVWLVLVRTSAVLALWPWLLAASVAAGLLTGAVALSAMRQLRAPREEGTKEPRSQGIERPASNPRIHESCPSVVCRSFLHGLAPELKLVAAAALGLSAALVSDLRVYAGLGLVLVVLSLLARVGPGQLVPRPTMLVLFVLGSFVLSVMSTNWGRLLLVLGPLRVTMPGVEAGLVFACRIVLLFGVAGLFAATTAPGAVARGLARLLSVLRPLGVRSDSWAQDLAQTWQAFPVFLEELKHLVRRRKGVTPAGLARLPGDIVAGLYQLAGQERAQSDECTHDRAGERPRTPSGEGGGPRTEERGRENRPERQDDGGNG